ncbi:MAG TPA: hypothetical protein VNL37_00560, partial [Candidatus Polarisedimenticolia bacterium]|nr:hypothetical protein [Candidatus Polarisedimenticolia bacterium]
MDHPPLAGRQPSPLARPASPRLHRIAGGAVILLVALLAAVPSGRAACPPGDANPITSGRPGTPTPVVLGGLGPSPQAEFFVFGHGKEANSFHLQGAAWLHPLADLDGDRLVELRVEAPAEGPGGWQDPLTLGCPSEVSPDHPPLVIVVWHEREDRDGDGRYDVFEDFNHNGRLDPGEDRDGDGRLTPPGGCEGAAREDLDCDGILDYIDEDVNHNGILDPGEDLDGDNYLDRGTEDRNGNRVLDDRPFPAPDDIVLDEHGVLDPSYPYGSLVPAPGGIVVASVAWNGSAYELSAIDTPTRPSTIDEDLDHDGAFDVFEDFNHNGRLDPGEDLDGDGHLTPPGGCEGATREDIDCDGHLDAIDEDANHNGILDPGEDLDGDGRLDPGTEDRNGNGILDDRPFPAPDDVLTGRLPDGRVVPIQPSYPYGHFQPLVPARIVEASPFDALGPRAT